MEALLLLAIRAALNAGTEILQVYEQGEYELNYKEDRSPLTLADQRAHYVIKRLLSESGFPVLSEEGQVIPYEERKQWKQFWLVDPLDGTKEFIKKNGEFTVNIALVQDRFPVLGVIYAPVKRVIYFASTSIGSYKKEEVADNKEIKHIDQWIGNAVRLPHAARKNNHYVVVASRSHQDEQTLQYIKNLENAGLSCEIVSMGSSFKICMVAEGLADEYPRFGPTMEWDTAAGQAIAEAAGCQFLQYPTMTRFFYNKENLRNPSFLVKRR